MCAPLFCLPQCAEVRCPSCEPPMPSTCPLPFLTDADLTAPCATNGEKCPSMLGTCNVWNGEECIERDNVGTCVCEDSIWASCAARECPQCPPPPSSCPDPYLAHDDVRLGCSIQGETCPYLSGTCDVWNGQECVPKDLVTKCSCDGNQWIVRTLSRVWQLVATTLLTCSVCNDLLNSAPWPFVPNASLRAVRLSVHYRI